MVMIRTEVDWFLYCCKLLSFIRLVVGWQYGKCKDITYGRQWAIDKKEFSLLMNEHNDEALLHSLYHNYR